MMFIDKWELKKYNAKKEIVFETKSSVGMVSKCFARALDDIDEIANHYDGYDCEIQVILKERK